MNTSRNKTYHPQLKEDEYHHYLSFWLALGSAFFQTIVFAVVIPTATGYSELLGQGRWFAGGIGALAAFIPGIMAPIWKRIEKHTSLKQCFQLLSVMQIIGTFLWSIGLFANSAYVLLVARIFSGLGSPANCFASYINRGIPQSKKTSATKMCSAIFSSAYAIGAFLAFGLTLIGQQFPVSDNTDSTLYKLFNQYTYPGWLCCVFYTGYLVAICIFFVEPPSIEEEIQDVESSTEADIEVGIEATCDVPQTKERDHKYLPTLVWTMLVFALSYTGIFSFTVASVMKVSGISLLYATLFLAVLMVTNSAVTMCSDLLSHISDQNILLAGYGILTLVVPLGFIAIDEKLIGGLGQVDGRGIAWGALAIYFIIFATAVALLNIVRAAILALCIKVPHPADRDMVISMCPAFTFMVATATGVMIGLALEPWQMLLIVCLLIASAFFVVLGTYKNLEAKVAPI